MPLLDDMARLGRPGRALSAKLDLLGFAGPGYYLRRLRDQRSFSKLDKRARDAFYEQIWREAAEAVGAEAVSLGPGRLELSRGSKSTRVHRQAIELDGQDTLGVALDKTRAHRLLVEAQVTVPEYLEFRFGDSAPREFLDRIGGPCVVKPAAGTGGGHGVTAGVVSPADLRRACIYAARRTDRLLMEQQAPGAVYRLLLLEGELLDVVRSTPERLTGDGELDDRQVDACGEPPASCRVRSRWPCRPGRRPRSGADAPVRGDDALVRSRGRQQRGDSHDHQQQRNRAL